MKLRLLTLLTVFALIFGLVLLGCEGPAGPQGRPGDQGEQGDKGIVGEKGLQGEAGPQGETGDAGPEGPEGPDGENGKEGDRGPTGDDGDSVYLKGHLDNLSDLDDLVGGETEGFVDAWMVNGRLYIWTVDTENPDGYWKESGQIWGPKGPEGPRGDEGEPGKDESGNAIVTVVFNSDGGTAVESEKLLAGGKVRRPSNPTKAFTRDLIYSGQPGLYNLNATGDYTFLGWFHNDVAWNFDVPVHVDTLQLTARWQPPAPIDISGQTGANILEKAISYVTGKTAPFVLLLNENITASTFLFNSTGMDFTIIGINYPGGGTTPRTIQSSSGSCLFQVGNTQNGSVTLENVRLLGTSNSTGAVVRIQNGTLTLNRGAAIMNNTISNDFDVQRGGLAAGVHINAYNTGSRPKLIMNEGSAISGNTIKEDALTAVKQASYSVVAAGVNVYDNGEFIMNGGTISGNSSQVVRYPVGGVRVHSGTFTMNGGTITNNSSFVNIPFQYSATRDMSCAGLVNSQSVTSTITLNGGSITGNRVYVVGSSAYDYVSDVGFLFPNRSDFTLSGSTTIGTLCLRRSGSGPVVINTVSGWTGSINAIDLMAYDRSGYTLADVKISYVNGDGGTETTAARILPGSVSTAIVDTFNAALAKGHWFLGNGADLGAIDPTEIGISRASANRGFFVKPVIE